MLRAPRPPPGTGGPEPFTEETPMRFPTPFAVFAKLVVAQDPR